MNWHIHQGDCIEVMAEMEEASVDAVVCDPPYGIGFMGHEWDQPGEFGPTGKGRSQPSPEVGAGHARERKPLNGHGKREGVKFGGPTGADNTTHSARGGAMHAGRYDLSLASNRRYQAWCEAWAKEAFRILKPGGHLLASCGTRTYHRLAAGVEDAGFEIRDSLLWLYGSGFPKSLDVSKAIDKKAGAEREVVGEADRKASLGSKGVLGTSREGERPLITAPVTPEAVQWQGWGTALKPSHEPIVVARKPFKSTVAENVLEHGTGALNIDGCRIKGEKVTTSRNTALGRMNDDGWQPTEGMKFESHDAGRWPPNVALSHLEECNGDCAPGCPVAELDAQSGDRRSSGEYDLGAARFFYCAKASRAERNGGLEGFPNVEGGMRSENSGQHLTRRDGNDPGPTKNGHPTVKPINLMRWLVRLVTPPGGTILDPFLGSGSTGCAAVLEGFDFIGIEREAEYVAIAEARIAFWAQHEGREVKEVLGLHAVSQREAKAHAEVGQTTLEVQT